MKITKKNSLNAFTIVERLPIHRQLSQSQSLLSKLMPDWLRWSDNNLDDRLSKCSSPIHYGEGILIIECTNAVVATQLQQRQESLLSYFHQRKLNDIRQIVIRLANGSTVKRNKHDKKALWPTSVNGSLSADGSLSAEGSINRSKRLNTKALNSIKSCQKQIEYKPLAESLSRLIELLESDEE